MPDTVIKVENLSKRYRIGERQPYKTIRESLVNAFKAPFHRPTVLGHPSSVIDHPSSVASPRSSVDNILWALKDVSFEVKQGEVVGIIGRNGAGKSTLLKILSKITEPTEGRIELKGRVGSLLEVGTGFHPELTGHENIYLYGAILGMDRLEITRKFDEIVAFAELEKFVDTPVKHYSSGMYMRLAFAVAAHLEPEILLVDEVLAVGDAAFQKKCLGKMEDVATGGRTILFVSHNMQAIRSLCQSVIHFDAGQIVASGAPSTIIAKYLSDLEGMDSEKSWFLASAPGNHEIKLLQIGVFDENGAPAGVYSSSKDFYVQMKFSANSLHSALCVGFDLVTPEGVVVARSYQTDLPQDECPKITIGENHWRCLIPKGLLNAGTYYLSPKIGMHNMYWIVNMDAIIKFEVILDHGISPFWNVLDAHNRPGIIAPILKWSIADFT